MFHTKRLEHNGEACIASLDQKDRGTERQFRFTRALLCTLLGVKSENTITNHVQALINFAMVNDIKNLTSLTIKNENGNGAVKTTLYDLKVFNYLSRDLEACLYGASERAQRTHILYVWRIS